MKIYIIGPCSTGKSTLASKLASDLGVKKFSLDEFYIDFESITRSNRKTFSRDKIEKDIDKVLTQKNWIVEGPYYEKELIEAAEMVIYTRRNLLTALIWQWKRFFTDPVQIQKWGVINNLLLSGVIINQYIRGQNSFWFQGLEYPTVKMFDRKLLRGKMIKKVQLLGHKNSVPVIK